MDESPELASQNFPEPIPYDPKEAFKAWEKLRWIYNLAVGLVGTVATLAAVGYPWLGEIIGAVMYGVLANICFCLGYWLEMADQHYLRGALGLHRFRVPIFVVGTVGSMIVTASIATMYPMVGGMPAMVD